MTMSERQRKIAFEGAIHGHLRTLSAYAGQPVMREELSPPEGPDAAEALLPAALADVRRIHLSFSERTSSRFRAFVEELTTATPQPPLLVRKSTANICGPLKLASLSDFNFGFEFTQDPGGIMSISTYDRMNRILLDYGEGADGAHELEVEWSGPLWSRVEYPEGGHAREV